MNLPRNSKWAIWIELVFLFPVLLFGLWGLMKGAWLALLIVAIALIFMIRQWRILSALNAPEEDEEGVDDDEEFED